MYIYFFKSAYIDNKPQKGAVQKQSQHQKSIANTKWSIPELSKIKQDIKTKNAPVVIP